MPQVIRILETCLHVEDVERSARFYETLFGFPRMDFNERFCAFDAGGGTVLLLFRKGGTTEPVRTTGGVIPPHGGSGDLHLAFSIRAEDLSGWEKRLSENGIAIESRVRWDRGESSLYFRDPDHHLVELATPGIWPSY
ncbi:MAG TPA: VOC family protein [Candidatus Acidoferrales bacterium]|jgi:catechol 2,3-dioxygenase-like lactoylglutathione lyase family enzyme|nr:VOC family protein [Candidatus Acidoferrales bacterium]